MDYTYGDNGYLSRRYSLARDWQANSRDGRGRLLQATTYAGAQTALTETMAYRGDGRLTTYSAVRGSDFTDSRTYAYASSQFLTQETFNLGSGQAATNNYSFDFGQSGGLGVLTSATLGGAASDNWAVPASGMDGLRRSVQSTNSLVKRVATGKVNGRAYLSATLNAHPLAVEYDPTVTNGGRWWADLDLRKGANTLVLKATLPNGLYTTNATSIFTNTDAGESLTNLYDGSGNVTVRMWKNGSGGTNRTQTLTWDGLGRLVKESLRDAFTNGYDRTCIYDGLGRRIRTVHTGIVSNVYQASVTTDSYYDPSVEFLETEIVCNGQRYWKIYGPDLNGVHGGLQGIGGLEAVFAGAGGLGTAMVSDHFGNIVGTNLTVQTTSFGWLPGRFCSYGPVAGYQQPQLSLNAGPTTVFGYLGKRVDETGRIYFGAREYALDERQWLSYDSMGWAGGHPYAYANGCPGYFYDPDGMDSVNWFQALFPAHAAGGGARPFTGGTIGDINAVHGMAYPALAPVMLPGAVMTEPHVQGGTRVIGGAVETGAGILGLATTTETGVGALVSGLAFVHGIDTLQSGWQQMISGAPTPSQTQQAITWATGSPTIGALADTALGIGLTLGASSYSASTVPAWHEAMQGEYTWGAPPGGWFKQGVGYRMRSDMGLVGTDAELHHWLIPQNQWGSWVPNYIKNQAWNIMVMDDAAAHALVDPFRGVSGVDPYPLPLRLWMGTPAEVRAATIGTVLGMGFLGLGGMDEDASGFSSIGLSYSTPLGKKPGH